MNVLWDSCSNLSFITLKRARYLNLHGTPAKLQVKMINGVTKDIDSEAYTIYIKDERGFKEIITVYGIDEISKSPARIDTLAIAKKLFPYVDKARMPHTIEGDTDILIGMQYAAFHPNRIDNYNHMLLYENRFGYAVAGSHPMIKKYPENIVQHAVVLNTSITFDALYSIENLGVSCSPKCGSCKCGKCHLGGKNMSIVEEQESILIESKLKFQVDKGRFIAGYPWIRNPSELPNNRSYAYAMLLATEKRLRKNEDYSKLYRRQIEDLLNRKVARKVTREELQSWSGAKFYIAHHGVMKPESKSTPCRLVFDSSHKVNGCSLNDFLAKGPSFLNDMLGILLRFREGLVGFVGDITKMFHSVDIPLEDQMVHLFFWRDMVTHTDPDVYAITVLNMGDKPSAAIAQIALKKTAEMAPEGMEKAQDTAIRNSYMDDILGSCDTIENAEQITCEITEILGNGGFCIKSWAISGHNCNDAVESDDQKVVKHLLSSEAYSVHQKVLGMYWDTTDDLLMFYLKAINDQGNLVTKRMILSKANSIYDPFGFLGPFLVKLKILLRLIWTHDPKLEWDDDVPKEIKKKWFVILDEIKKVSQLRFLRSLKPPGATGDPELILFSDGSKQAYGAVAYIRWNTKFGVKSRLVAAKSRIAPLKVQDIVRLELCGATLSARLRTFISNELDLSFKKVHHFVDSNIVKSMIKKGSYGFNTFDGNRLGEIHRNSRPEEWHWIEGELNIADIITRGASPEELGEGSTWQCAPAFLQLPEDEWPIDVKPEENPPGQNKSVFVAVIESEKDSLAKRIEIERYSRLMLLIHTTARILKLYKRYSIANEMSRDDKEIMPYDLQEATLFWIKQAQATIHSEIDQKKYIKLQPKLVDGVFQVGGRVERWMEATWNKQKFILLPKEHRLSYLISLYEHKRCGHLASAATVSMIRSKYWIVDVKKIVNSIISKCVPCKRKFKRFESQIMSPLPTERIKPSPPFFNVGVDYFGPYAIKGEIQKRTRGKGFGVLITCLSSRAVYVDLANDYSTNGFIQVYRRFVTMRGSPRKIFSDNGTCLVGASNELKDVIKKLDWKEIHNYGVDEGTEWVFSPGNAPWYNGATEALVKSVKRALNAMVGESIFTFSELQTALFEAAQLVNQRPIGHHPSKPDEGSYLCPNDLLLGRATTHVPQGPFQDRSTNKHRIDFIEEITKCFWKKWTREIFPSLVISPKWHTERRNVKKGDVVLIYDSNTLRGHWKMGTIAEAIPSQDGRIRRANVSYKNPDETVQRPVQKLIVIVPIDGDLQ